MIFAAGLGTRLRPLTNNLPKALVRVGEKTLLQLVIEKLKLDGFEKIIVNVHHLSNQIKEYLNENQNFGIDIKISDETNDLLNTGGGIKAAQYLFGEGRILIHNVDILSNVNLQHFYNAYQDAEATLLVSKRKTKRYLLFNDELTLVGWTNIETGEVKSPYPNLEISKCKPYAFAGIHCFSPRLFTLMDAYPDKFSIIDFYLDICKTLPIKAYVDDNLKLLDVGKQDTISKAKEFLKQIKLSEVNK